jgi:hypothetical protein
VGSPEVLTPRVHAVTSGIGVALTGFIIMPDPKDDPKSSEWRPHRNQGFEPPVKSIACSE